MNKYDYGHVFGVICFVVGIPLTIVGIIATDGGRAGHILGGIAFVGGFLLCLLGIELTNTGGDDAQFV